MIYYLPSCKVKANLAIASEKLQRYLSDKGVSVCGCCKLSQNLFKKDDMVITNCTSCAIITDESSPFVNEVSLYEYLLKDESFPWPDYQGESITIQDCYRAAHKPEVQMAVRRCLEKMNFKVVEIAENFEKTTFDGTFVYNPIPAPTLKGAPIYYGKFNEQMIKLMDKDDQEEEMRKWVSQYTTARVVTYCNSCYKGVLLGGANGVHIIDLLVKNLQRLDYVRKN